MPRFSAIDALDILIVSYVLYRLMLMLRGTRATAIIKGLILLFVASAVSRFIGLPTVSWLLQQGTTVILVALPIVFYPELRRALERLGRGPIFRPFSALGREDFDKVTEEIIRAARRLSSQRTGALIAIERDVGLEEYAETGVRLEALLTSELLATVFHPNTPLHDGAVIVRGDRIFAAGCVLPLTDNRDLAQELGTRHRAAIGVSEESDALVIVVSEETGAISIASEGKLEKGVSDDELRRRLRAELQPEITFGFRKSGAAS